MSSDVPLAKRISEFFVRAGADVTTQIIVRGKIDDPVSAACFGALGFFVTGPFNVRANDAILRATPSSLRRLLLSTLGHTPALLSIIIGYRALFAYVREQRSKATASEAASIACNEIVAHMPGTLRRALPYQIPVVFLVQKFLPPHAQTYAFQLYAYLLTTFVAYSTSKRKNKKKLE